MRRVEDALERRQFEARLAGVRLSYMALLDTDCDLAHAWHPADALAAARWTRRRGRPSVLSYPALADRLHLVARRRRLGVLQRAAAGVTAITASSRAASDALQRWVGIDARVIHPGIDLEAFSPGDGRTGVPTISCIVEGAASEAQADLFARALPVVRRDCPDARLVIVSGARTAAVHRATWVTAEASERTAFPFASVEALACGRPVVGPASGAVAEVVGGESVSSLFEPGDPADLARALLDALALAGDPGTPEACRTRAETFSIRRSVDQFLALYDELLAR